MPTAQQEVLIFPSRFAPEGALGSTTPNAQNSTFANPMKKSGCKRAVFLPSHPSPPTTLEDLLTRIEIKKKVNKDKLVF